MDYQPNSILLYAAFSLPELALLALVAPSALLIIIPLMCVGGTIAHTTSARFTLLVIIPLTWLIGTIAPHLVS
jgi:hypothetical protein